MDSYLAARLAVVSIAAKAPYFVAFFRIPISPFVRAARTAASMSGPDARAVDRFAAASVSISRLGILIIYFSHTKG